METAIVSLVCIALIVFGGMTMSRGFMTSVDSTAQALESMGQRSEKIMRTELTPTYAATQTSGTYLNVYLTNNGQTKVADFSKWDIIVQYYDGSGGYHVTWLPYTSGPLADNQWINNGIYLTGSQGGQAEVFDPGILNPGEEIRIRARLSPAVGNGTTDLVTISTPNGVPASIAFTS
jgi:hypothetical protein